MSQGNFLGRKLPFSMLLFLFVFIPANAQELSSADSTREMIDIGYGFIEKQSVTGSVAAVKSDDFTKGNVHRPEYLIQGKVAGLSVTKPGGNPNEAFYMRLRGLSTINANTQPLWIIDGVIGASPENLDPGDIESITVLKDAASAVIFGMRGAAGVLLIRTRTGAPGKVNMEYSSSFTTEKVAKNAPFMDAGQWRALSAEVGAGTDFGSTTDWFEEIEQTALSQTHNFSLSGGTDKSVYRASFNYRDVQGVLNHSGFKQLNGRLNLTQKALRDRFVFHLNIGATTRESQFSFQDAFGYAAIFNPTAPVKSDDPTFDPYDGYFQQIVFDYYNPVSLLELNRNEGNSRLLNISAKGAYEFFREFKVDVLYSLESGNSLSGMYYDRNQYYDGYYRNGLASRSERNSVNRLFETTGHWHAGFGSDSHLNLSGGYSCQDFTYEGFAAEGGDFLTDHFTFNNLAAALDFKNGRGTITSDKNTNRLVAFFGRASTSLNNIWFLSASIRYEGSSRLGINHKYGLFGSIGGGMDLYKIFDRHSRNHLKVRMNYGVTGNQPAESYLSLATLTPQIGIYFNGRFIPGYVPERIANPDLKHEKKSEFDAGIDFSLAESRVSGSLDLYTATASDLLYHSYTWGQPNLGYYVWLNLGKIRNSGIELTLDYDIIRNSNFTYTVHLDFTGNLKSKLVSLSGNYKGQELDYKEQHIGFPTGPGSGSSYLVKLEEGKPIGQLYGYVFEEINEDGQLILSDIDKSGYIDNLDQKVIGNGLPKSLLGFGNSFTYKNWDLDIFFRGVLGHDLLNCFRVSYEAPSMITSYNLPITAGDLRNPETNALMNSWPRLSSYHVENASFLSLDNLSLGYDFTLPEKSVFSRIRISLAVNNLFYITKYKGSDPNPRYEDSWNNYGYNVTTLVPGVDRKNTWCRTRSFTLGANVVF
ncbi:MAG: SusC/RagA family TonB-linked outer membrane protein [Bacteroidales bacterium]|nr:SusC/RagA family TonB-linked outer membrane protein [Bacteroidales bacterium]